MDRLLLIVISCGWSAKLPVSGCNKSGGGTNRHRRCASPVFCTCTSHNVQSAAMLSNTGTSLYSAPPFTKQFRQFHTQAYFKAHAHNSADCVRYQKPHGMLNYQGGSTYIHTYIHVYVHTCIHAYMHVYISEMWFCTKWLILPRFARSFPHTKHLHCLFPRVETPAKAFWNADTLLAFCGV